MLKTIIKFGGYILLKWTVFYIYQFIEGGNKIRWGQSIDYEGRILAVIMLLGLPLIEILLLYFPFQLALKEKGLLSILLLISIFILEFFIGWYTTNQRVALWMFIKIIISAVLFLLIYKKQIRSLIFE